MIGDTFQGRIYWHDWLGGQKGIGHPRECTGTVEHVSVGWVLIRRPRGGLRLKRLSRRTLGAGRLSAFDADHANIFRQWLDDDEDARRAKRERFAAAKIRHQADRDEAAFWESSVHPDDNDDGMPF